MRRALPETRTHEPLPIVSSVMAPLRAFQPCRCGTCSECKSNAKWDRVFAKFEAKHYGDEKGVFGSPLSDF